MGRHRRSIQEGPHYRGYGPKREGEVTSCFEDGLLYRIVNGDRWSYYNDSQEYEMHLKITLGPKSKVKPLGCTTITKSEDGSFVLSLVVYPYDTEDMFEGQYDTIQCAMNAKALSDAYREKVYQAASAEVDKAIAAVKNASNSIHESEVLTACISRNVMFVDLIFPPKQKSLSPPNAPYQLKKFPWMRPKDYLTKKDKEVLFNKIEPEDIDQGQLGDCWLMCSIAALAEFPQYVERLFVHPVNSARAKEEQAVGAYRVLLNKNGWWRNVILDNCFAVMGGAPVYGKNKEDLGELWVSLLEKAYAKVHGSYVSIVGGDPLHALQDLTGYPYSRFDTEWKEACSDSAKGEAFFKHLVHYDEAGYLLNVNTPGRDNSDYMGGGENNEMEEHMKRMGLAAGHAYTVQVVKYFPQHNIRLMKIRNPWGDGTEWNGSWNDNDSKWQEYPDVARACNHTVEADSCFWMEWEDVKRYFEGGGVCFVQPSWFDYRVKGSFMGVTPSLVFEITVTKRVETFLVLSLKDRRGLQPEDPESKYPAAILSVAQPTGHSHAIHLNSTSDADSPSPKFFFNYGRDHSLHYKFEPAEGTYLVIPRLYQPTETERSFTLGIISSAPMGDGITVKFKKIGSDCKALQNFPNFNFRPEGDVKTQYQHTPSKKTPINRSGTSLAF